MKTLAVSHTGKSCGWGAVYAQYLEDMDRVKAFEMKGPASFHVSIYIR